MREQPAVSQSRSIKRIQVPVKLGLLGYPVSHSMSPLMHTAALHHCKLEGSYDLIDCPSDQLVSRWNELKQSYLGINVTLPYKEKVLELVNDLTAEASLVRAVNTVRFDESGKVIGHNTDIGGFMTALLAASNMPSL